MAGRWQSGDTGCWRSTSTVPGRRSSRRKKNDLDVADAVAFLRGKGVSGIVLIGASRGGVAVVTAGSKIAPPVDAVVSISAPAAFAGMDAREAAAKLTMPEAGTAVTDFAREAMRSPPPGMTPHEAFNSARTHRGSSRASMFDYCRRSLAI